MMKNNNILWTQIVVEELSHCGLHHVCITPGSRSTPLALEFSASNQIRAYSLIDERSSGYFALGMANALEEPVAVICTSGTAAANLYPAIIEANYAHIPMLILTADRPPELRSSGANQTIDQLKMFGDHVRWFMDVPLPEGNPSDLLLRSLRTMVDRAFSKANGINPGPVHLNFPFRKPLEPDFVRIDEKWVMHPIEAVTRIGDPVYRPFTEIKAGKAIRSDSDIIKLVDKLVEAKRGWIICGPRSPRGEFLELVSEFSVKIQFPIFADALSGVRFHKTHRDPKPVVFGGYESFLVEPLSHRFDPPDIIMQFGSPPISNSINDYLDHRPDIYRIQISSHGEWEDPHHSINRMIFTDPEQLLRSINERLSVPTLSGIDQKWLDALVNLENLVWEETEHFQRNHFSEWDVLTDLIQLAPDSATLHIASSLSVRHLDQFAKPSQKNLKIYSNRGASGIDGCLASGFGVAAVSKTHVYIVAGDLAAIHDLNSLMLCRRFQLQVTLIIINNDGGGIFYRLPVAKFEPAFTDLFLTRHGLDFQAFAGAFGYEYTCVEDREAFQAAIVQDSNLLNPRMIEVKTDADQSEKNRQELMGLIRDGMI